MIVTLHKLVTDGEAADLPERSFVNLYTKNNISFNKGCILFKHQIHNAIKTVQVSAKSVPHKTYEEVVIEYLVEFSHQMPNNISFAALGGQHPTEFEWTLEIEPFSSFSFAVMRNNIFQLCLQDK
jgi:hypothetical protein